MPHVHNMLSRTDDIEGTNTMTMPELSRDEVLVLLEQESTVYRTCDYLGTKTAGSLPASPPEYVVTQNGVKKRRLLPASSSHQVDDAAINETTKNKMTMNPDWRLKMIEWAYKVVDHFDIDRGIVSVATNYLDRCLASTATNVLDKGKLQLLTMSCLYLAIKLNETCAIQICGSKSTMDSMLHLARSRFSIEQMREVEYDVLQRLQWRMHPPTPQIFIEYFAIILCPNNPGMLKDQALYLIELAALDYYFVTFKPSEIALAALWNAMKVVFPDQPAYSLPRLNEYVFDPKDPRVVQCQNRLVLLLQESEASVDRDANRLFRVSSPVSVTSPPN